MIDLRPLRAEISHLGGTLAWTSSWGIGVSFEGLSLRSFDMMELPQTLPRIVWLDLSQTEINDNVFPLLLSARKLEALSISNTRTSMSGLKLLKCLPELVEIDAADTWITSADVVALRCAGWRANIDVHRRGAFSPWFPGFHGVATREDR